MPIVSLKDFERGNSMRMDCCILMYFTFKSPLMVTITVFLATGRVMVALALETRGGGHER